MKHKFYNIRGTRYANLGQLDTAISYYEKALSIKPNYAEAHYNLGFTRQKLGQLDAAVRSYKKVKPTTIVEAILKRHPKVAKSYMKGKAYGDFIGCWESDLVFEVVMELTKKIIDNVYLRTIALRGNLKTYRGNVPKKGTNKK